MNDKTTDFDRWTKSESLLSHWNGRAAFASQFIQAGTTVLDIGCGAMALEGFLPPTCTYLPCDVHTRDPRTILCNLNAGEFPKSAAAEADHITFLGVLEYIENVPALLEKLRKTGKNVLFTYHPTEISGHLDRASLGWINAFSQVQVFEMIKRAGLRVMNVERVNAIQYLYNLSPTEQPVPAPKLRVAVLSYASLGNFGDRLGYHMIQSVLPAHAEVTHHFFDPWTEIDPNAIDLLVLGIGNSLFEPLLNDRLLKLVAAAPKTIGIFGTQYRSRIPRERMAGLLEHVDTWYARYQEDVHIYGDLCAHTVHLGDWLIDAFPLARADRDETLRIGKEIWGNQPLDRTIQHIQRYRTVFSPSLHPLLCALTSAEVMGYVEQRGFAGEEVSGKFRSMLIDIFDRTYPENLMCGFDRDKVQLYKEKVSRGVAALRKQLHACSAA